MGSNPVNRQSVAIIAKDLKELCSKMVFVGGAVISFYVDDEAADEIRPTFDIDMTIQLAGYSGWAKMQERLTQIGFSPDPEGHAICSYLHKGISIDIMPSEDGPFGDANRWYKPGFEYLLEVTVEENAINILSAPYFLATKFEAFNGRGGDYRTSHDFEDIIYLIDNRIHIVEEVSVADEIVKAFIKDELTKVMNSPYSEEIIRSQINPLMVDGRYPIVLDKINRMIY